MGQVILLSFTSAFNPTLIAVTTLMLLLPNPKRLMLGYYCGAMLTRDDQKLVPGRGVEASVTFFM